MTGLDTGFFIELLNGNGDAISLWNAGMNEETELIVSCLTLFEIERLGCKGKLQQIDVILEAINAVTFVVWLDRDMLSLAARLSHGLGIPSVDSLILASLLSKDVSEIYTTDAHFEAYQSHKIVVRNLRKSG